MPERRPWWHVKLRAWGYRVTIPREAVIELLNWSKKHPSADDIYFTVHRTYPTIGLTTVYRTLELLEQMGIIRKLLFGDGRSRYEISDGPRWRYHQHLFCTKCGRVTDYMDFVTEEDKLLKKIGAVLSKKYKFRIKTHQLHFYGVCKKCR
jgi:Fur family ferric uptake transcriptional regulator